MSIAKGILAEMEHEAKVTRELLARVPAKPDYKPHPKSMAMGLLAGHIVEMARWGMSVLGEDVFVFDPAKYVPLSFKSGKEAAAAYEKAAQEFRAALGKATDVQMLETWKMVVGDKTFMEMPRAAVIRSMIVNHTIHHRAQLGVYLRLNDVPLPQTYGPSADEGM
jgi:uncharacterized damage-inducible protein DinB